MFDAPIPGQSLTDEPKNHPWENPPELSTVSETLDFYMEKLTDTDVIDNLLMMLQVGMPVEKITSTLTLGGVMEGKHTLDVQLLVNPVVHKYIALIGKKAKIDFTDGFSPDPEERKKQKNDILSNRLLTKELNALEDTPRDQKDEGDVLMEQTLEAFEVDEINPEMSLEDTDTQSDTDKEDDSAIGLIDQAGLSTFRKRRNRQESFPEDVSLGMIKRMDEQVGIKRDAEGFPLKSNNERMTEEEYFATMGDLLDKRDENFYNIRNYGEDAMRGRSFGFPTKKGLMRRGVM